MWWNSRKTSAIATPVIISYAKLTWNSLGQTLLNTPEEQIGHLTEQLQKAKETNQLRKMKCNEQIRLMKEE
ncbi:hypothetical protein LSAT2_000758 [Lamellibrachia satsuma]|nr:hypothetical protein LSAT2_000758 [Lamellibrachia satsuma]